MIEDRYTHNNEDLAYLSPIDLNIATKVTPIIKTIINQKQ